MAKPRDVFFMTLSNALLIDMPTGPDYKDMLQTMEDIEVHVIERGSPVPPATPTYVKIFQSGDLAQMAEGPTSTSGAKIPDTATNNPFRTGPSGNIEFWAEGPKEIDVFIHDTIPSPQNRIVDRKFGWNATAVGPESLPTSMLVKDAGLTLQRLAPDVMRQFAPIGTVIDWWRPSSAVAVPPGYVICDGQQVLAADHEFPAPHAGTNINVPDLRNTFILGADPTKAHAAGAGQGNPPVNAPGIAGTGGSNAAKDLRHGHGVPGVDHVHWVGVPDHLHTAGPLYTGDHAHGGPEAIGGLFHNNNDSAVTLARPWGIHAVGNVGIGGTTGASDRGLAVNSGGSDRWLGTATNSTTWTNDPGSGGQIVDIRPKFVGLLKLMKVRRS